ncbi:MAG: DedA family protein [Bacilli bacterium]|nr:DedA family protein [Bacilli bacterium]
MDNYILELINDFGYFGMFFGMVLEAVIIIIPSELILATGGILAGRGIFNFWLSFLIGLLGSVFCAIVIYMMGYYGGYPFVNKYGKYFFMKSEDITKSNSWFDKYGLIAAAVGRNIPIVRTLISLPVGIARLSFKKFVVYTTLGSIPWTFVFVYFGYSLGNNWTVLSNITSKLKVPIKILLIILVVNYIYKKIKQHKKKDN